MRRGWRSVPWSIDMDEAGVARSGLVEVEAQGRCVQLEVAWVGRDDADAPLMVFLHEGLGSVSMWRDFPQRLCEAAGLRGLVWSRAGYGRSTPRAPHERWGVDFMHEQARVWLPALMRALGVDAARARPWLLGHSDGGSIALIHAASFPEHVAGLVVLAPHIFVEDVSVSSIERARLTYETTDLRDRLARHHDDPDSAFRGWNDIWLDPAFRNWSIVDLLQRVRVPVLAIQGEDDEYGTMRQIDGIAEHAPDVRLLKLARCGHSPQRDAPQAVMEAVTGFLRTARAAAAPLAP